MASVSKPTCAQSRPTPRFTWPASFERFSVFRFFYLALIFNLFSIAFGDKTYYANREVRSCVCDGTFNASLSKDYFPFKSVSELSGDFWNVTYHNSYKKLQVFNADDNTVDTFYLYLCGTEAPDASDGTLVEIPVQSAMFASSTHLGLFEYIGQRSSISEYFDPYSSGPVWSNACMQAEYEDGLFSIITDDALSKADVVFGSAKIGSLPTVVLQPGSGPFAQLENVELLALFFNREEAANEVVSVVEDRYNCNKAKANAVSEKKTVLYMSFDYFSFNHPTWGANKTCQGGDSIDDMSVKVVSCDPALPHPSCQGFADAGANYFSFDAGGDKEKTFTMAEFLALDLSSVDVAFYKNDLATALADCKDQLDSKLGQVKFWTEGEVYDIYGLGKEYPGAGYVNTGFFESGAAEPDVILLDYIEVLYPSLVDHERVFFRKGLAPNVETMVTTTADMCIDRFAPLYNSYKETACNENSQDVTLPGLEAVQNSDVCGFVEDLSVSAQVPIGFVFSALVCLLAYSSI